MAKISIATIRSLVNYLSNSTLAASNDYKNICRDKLLAEINISELQLNQNTQLIDSTKYEALYSLAEREIERKDIGFEFGKSITADRWGILGYIAFTSATLKDALSKQFKYQSLAGNLGTPISELNNECLLLKWIPAHQCNHHVVEEIITGWAALANNLSQNKIKPSAVYFHHTFKGNIVNKNCYADYFGCPVYFDHDFNGIEIMQSLLDIPLITVDDIINQALCHQADNMLSNIIEQSPIESINQFIINQLPLGVPEIDDAAKQLGLSVRTLQRKLSDNQLNFTSMIDKIRKELALSYLKNTNTKVIYIAQMLGFSEQSAFQRAFKRWTGQTPKQCRNSQ
jgi:AraC-like DNA-binding protein